MGIEPMELAKNYKAGKTPMPAMAQLKVDGVPITFMKTPGTIVALSRQNEDMPSCMHLLPFIKHLLTEVGSCVTMECTVPGLSFKDAAGIIRRKTPDEDTAKIVGIIWDYDFGPWTRRTYSVRMEHVRNNLPLNKKVRVASSHIVHTEDDILLLWRLIKERMPTAEGIMLHDPNKLHQPGKRCWGMGRWKPQPTIDLAVTGFEEAVSEAGEPLGMVGRVNVQLVREFPSTANLAELAASGWTVVNGYPGGPHLLRKIVGVGPGKLTHDERKDLWETAVPTYEYSREDVLTGKRVPRTPRIAEIKYMPDPDYDALRQPTFQRWRSDKQIPDILRY